MERKKLTKAQRLRVYNMYGGRCAYCGRPIRYEDMQVDHMVPLYNGGADNEGNYVPACRMCNHYKSTYTVEKLREQLGMLQERLRKDYIYRLALQYGLVREAENKITFFFEKKRDQEEELATETLRSKIENG